jgi:RNA polymerase sigma factor for flagellar operon FliA
MVSMEGVPASLIVRNESWVRQHANSLARRLPSNIERADLIQVGLIAVAQAALSFVWNGDRGTDEADEAFVRYARKRVHGAMIDELRQMDHLSRNRRRQVKLLQVARERWLNIHGADPSAADLSALCGLSVDEIFEIEHDAMLARPVSNGRHDDEDEGAATLHEAATPQDEVEARVDTAMLMRRLEGFFACLPERDRLVIDAYLGVGLTPVQLAQSLQVSPSWVSQRFKSVVNRIEQHMAKPGQRSIDRVAPASASQFDQLVTQRESVLAQTGQGGAWGQRLEKVLVIPAEELAERYPSGAPIIVDVNTRWG